MNPGSSLNSAQVSHPVPSSALPGGNADALSKVLIVDDTVFAIQILKMYCQKVCNIKVDTAISGEEAIMMVQQRISCKQPVYRLIVMDINMPGLDGVQTTANIRGFLMDYIR